MKLSKYSLESLRDMVTGDGKDTPYLSGQKLVDLFNSFGFRDLYKGGLPQNMSRNFYALDRLDKLNGSNELKGLLLDLVDDRKYIMTEFNSDKIACIINKIIKSDGYRLEKVNDVYALIGDNIDDDKVEVEVHFKEIQSQIIEQIRQAKYTIWVAVAWFTDKVLFNELLNKKAQGVNVQVIVADDDINRKSGFDYEGNFEAYRVQNKGMYDNIMHNKFCIVDLKTVIHGSYNWTNRAKYNKETITIDTSRELAEKFASKFIELKTNY